MYESNERAIRKTINHSERLHRFCLIYLRKEGTKRYDIRSSIKCFMSRICHKKKRCIIISSNWQAAKYCQVAKAEYVSTA
jgi:hypothetical protein